MGTKKPPFPSHRGMDFIFVLLVLPLLILEWIGDRVIYLLKLLIKIVLIPYNLYLFIFDKIYTFIKFLIISLYQFFCSTLSKTGNIEAPRAKARGIFGIISFNPSEAEILRIHPRLESHGFLRRRIKISFRFPKISWKNWKFRLPASVILFFIKVKYFFLGALLTGLLIFVYFTQMTVASLPNPKTLTLGNFPVTTKIYDRNNILLYEIYAEENRTPLPLADIPDIVKTATIAIEDKEFYFHQGFSFTGITRALIHNLQENTLEGGSTITQQLVRNAFLTSEKTYLRKIKELVLSVWTEYTYSKDEILEMYLNQVPYGGTVWGIETAADTYFGKKVQNLTLAEAALLAGLPASPSKYSPNGSHPELTRERQIQVLNNMYQEGYIDSNQLNEAINQPLVFNNQIIAIEAPHFVMYVREILERYYGVSIVEKGGLRVTTSLDLSLQKKVQNILANEVGKLSNLQVGNGAVLITDPKNGEILSMVGSVNYFDSKKDGNVNLTTSLRQPGSAIKVVTYAEALSHGFTAATILYDTPVTFNLSGQTPYTPVNYDGKFHGAVTLRTALASSYNIPAVKTLFQIGQKNMINRGRMMGISSWNDDSRFGLSLTLGGGEVTMLDMARVYGTLANSGNLIALRPILSVTNYKGEKLPLPPIRKTEAVSEEIAFIISSILTDNVSRTPAFGPNSALVIPGKSVAVKTGTSDNKRDNWTIGFTPNFVVATWVGNNDNSPMHPTLTSGVTGAAPIWKIIMTDLLQEKPDEPFPKPEKITSVFCYGRTEYFVAGTVPQTGCRMSVPSSTKPTN